MELTVLDSALNRVKVLDIFDSLLWTDRYTKYGTFEIYTKATNEYIAALPEDHILTLSESEHAMFIETIRLTTDVEEGDKFIVTGRSLESMLDRRIIWKQTVLSGSLQTAIERLLNENAIAPEDPDRRIPNLIFESSIDPAITTLGLDAQYTGDSLYSAIQNLCSYFEVGFKITISPEKKFVFSLYAGKDRSFSQIANPFVAFSPQLDNLSSTNYFHSIEPHRTITLVAGEGEGSARVTTQVALPGGANTGLERREKFTDARDISSLVDGQQLTESEYNTLLVQRGIISLLESQQVSSFDGKVDPTTNYVYGIDFFLGDVVQIENEYGIRGRSRVTEVVFSEDLGGRDIYPTFEMID
jgi:hypothetical protein